jgi:YD repeat-containing protein
LGYTTSTYHTQDFLAAVRNAAGLQLAVTFDSEDHPHRTPDAHGVTVTTTYEALRRLRTRTYPEGGVEAFGYSYGFAAPPSYTNQLGTVTCYGYDAAGRKTSEVHVAQASTRFT